MGRRTRAWHVLQGSKAEALLAVDAYNRSGERRSLEAFVVHMHLAWLYLLQACLLRDRIDFRYRQKDGRHFVKVDGEPKTWELARCVAWRWPNDNDPIRQNIEFFIGLRNKIEHRYEAAVAAAVAGHAQAHILNYEGELVAQFGEEESLGQSLRFPVFISTLTPQGVEAVKQLRARVPAKAVRYLAEFHERLDPSVAEDQRFEFRIHLVPQIGPRSEADMAIKFIPLDQLDARTLKALAKVGKTGLVGIRLKERPVKNLKLHRPREIVEIVKKEVPSFNMATFVRKWKEHAIRPPAGAADPYATDEKYAVYDELHRDYAYTDAYAKKLVREAKEELET